jgi:hypothetical protein
LNKKEEKSCRAVKNQEIVQEKNRKNHGNFESFRGDFVAFGVDRRAYRAFFRENLQRISSERQRLPDQR